LSDDLEQLERLRIATHTQRLPPDVGQWAMRLIAATLPASDRKAKRDRLLRDAASMIPGSLWRKVTAVSEIIERLRNESPSALSSHAFDGPAELVFRAWTLDPSLPRFRRLFCILSAPD